MRVVAFNGSARRDGNTARLVRRVFEPLEAGGVECELVQLADHDIRGCRACGRCKQERDGSCHGVRDDANALIDRMREADAVLLASPVYFADVSSEMKALIDRAGYALRANGETLKRRLGAAIVAVRRVGAIHAFDTLNHFFLINQMIVVGSSYWNVGIGREAGEVEYDEEGMRTMTVLGENLLWALERLRGE